MTRQAFARSPLYRRMQGKELDKFLSTLIRSVLAMDPLPAQETSVYKRRRVVTRRLGGVAGIGRRMQVMSARTSFNVHGAWNVHVYGVKAALSRKQDLFIVIPTPDALFVYRHDLKLGVSGEGKFIRLIGAHCVDFDESFSVILAKLDGPESGCERILELPLSDPRVTVALEGRPPSLNQMAYSGVPLAKLNPKERGRTLERLLRRVLGRWTPDILFADPIPGRVRRPQREDLGWIHNGSHIDCTTARLAWYHSRWRFAFTRTPEQYHEVLLSFYSPRGVHVYQYDFRAGVHTAGKIEGQLRFSFYGPMWERDWSAALDHVLAELDATDCRRVAFIPWATGE